VKAPAIPVRNRQPLIAEYPLFVEKRVADDGNRAYPRAGKFPSFGKLLDSSCCGFGKTHVVPQAHQVDVYMLAGELARDRANCRACHWLAIGWSWNTPSPSNRTTA
jgi:hypothetical protein